MNVCTNIYTHGQYAYIREGVREKNPEKLCPFDKAGEGGSKKEKKANLYFGKVFFSMSM